MLPTGTKIDHYEILKPIGEGAMGEVCSAKDTRLGRKVAIKILPSELASDPDRLSRFEQEAKAVGMLNHPNILAVYDIGHYQGSPYLVSELLEGQTLHERLGGVALSPRKVIEYALQIAAGLGAAHEKGITHRDLKPENIFITKDGRVKILDFGLAKLTRSGAAPAGQFGSDAPKTAAGIVMGTVGYMSPEQVRGLPVDHRSDIFSFGVLLYEMLTGKRAFKEEGDTETMHAILKSEPPPIPVTHSGLSPALEHIIRHCLEKNPEDRFRSAHDIAFDLATLTGDAPGVQPSRLRALRGLVLPAAAALAVIAALAGFYFGQRMAKSVPPSFHLLTFRRGSIQSAHFAPDGQTIVYGAAWDGNPVEIFSTRPEGPDSRALGFPDTEILSISSNGEMAISVKRRSLGTFVSSGTLARASLAGGASREILEDVQEADWGPDGSNLATVHDVAGRSRLEFPAGKTLYETAGWISHPRVSPKGNLVAFVDHPVRADDGGAVAVVDLAGKKRTLASGWLSIMGLAWAPKSGEIWFTATRVGVARALYAVSLNGKERVVSRMAGTLTLDDISRDGRVLVTRDSARRGMMALAPGEKTERDLSWLDRSLVRGFSPDGRTVLFLESGEGGGATYAMYIRKTNGEPAVKIGEGSASDLSPDGKWALSIASQTSASQLILYPTGTGEPRRLERQGINYQFASFFPDGNRILIAGNEPGHAMRLYVQDLAGGKARPLTPEGISDLGIPVSPDGRWAACRNPEGKLVLYPVEGGEPREISGLDPDDTPTQWGSDSHSLYVYKRAELPAKVYRVDLTTGHKEFWKEFMPADPAGVSSLAPILHTPDGKSYVYCYRRELSELYLVDGLK